MKLSYPEELVKSIDIYLDLLTKLENFDYERMAPAFSKAQNDSSELIKISMDETTNKIEALNILSVAELEKLYESQKNLEETIGNDEENLSHFKSSTRFAYNELIEELPEEGCPAYLTADYEKTRDKNRDFILNINEQIEFIINKINRKNVIIKYDFNRLVMDARKDLQEKNQELSGMFPEFIKALEARPIGGVTGDAEKNIVPFIYELRNRAELIQSFFDEQDVKLQEAKALVSPKIEEAEQQLEENKEKLKSLTKQLEENDEKDDKAQQIFAELSDKYLEILPPIVEQLYKDPAIKEYLSLLEKLDIENLNGFSFMNLGYLYQLGALLCGKVAPVELDETFSVVCRNKYNEIIDSYINTDEHNEPDKAFCTCSNPKASNTENNENKEKSQPSSFETETEAGKKSSLVKEELKKLHALPVCHVFKKDFLKKLKTFVSDTNNVDLIDVFEHFAEDEINDSLAFAKDFVSFKTLYRATPEQKIAIDNEYYKSNQAKTAEESYSYNDDFTPYISLSQSDLEEIRLERIEREAYEATIAAERAAEIEKIDRDLAKRREERDRQEAQREQMRAQSAANMRCARCANHDACGNSRGVINCGAFTPKRY